MFSATLEADSTALFQLMMDRESSSLPRSTCSTGSGSEGPNAGHNFPTPIMTGGANQDSSIGMAQSRIRKADCKQSGKT